MLSIILVACFCFNQLYLHKVQLLFWPGLNNFLCPAVFLVVLAVHEFCVFYLPLFQHSLNAPSACPFSLCAWTISSIFICTEFVLKRGDKKTRLHWLFAKGVCVPQVTCAYGAVEQLLAYWPLPFQPPFLEEIKRKDGVSIV